MISLCHSRRGELAPGRRRRRAARRTESTRRRGGVDEWRCRKHLRAHRVATDGTSRTVVPPAWVNAGSWRRLEQAAVVRKRWISCNSPRSIIRQLLGCPAGQTAGGRGRKRPPDPPEAQSILPMDLGGVSEAEWGAADVTASSPKNESGRVGRSGAVVAGLNTGAGPVCSGTTSTYQPQPRGRRRKEPSPSSLVRWCVNSSAVARADVDRRL